VQALQPSNNCLERKLTWNEDGILDDARHITIAGHYFYVAADVGIVVLNMDDLLEPEVAAVISLRNMRSTAVQFCYLFAIDRVGLKVVDVTRPDRPRMVQGAVVPLEDANRVYVRAPTPTLRPGARVS
jgi:hypothetical protein